jgi:hypothetical protein
MLNRILAAVKSVGTKQGLMALAVSIGTIAVVNRVPKLRQIVKGE